MKGKYTDKRLNFTTSTEARFVLGMIFSPNRGSRAGKTGYANLRTFPHSRQNAGICSWTWNQNVNKKIRKGEKNQKEEKDAKPKMSREQKPVGMARERTTTMSGNSMRPFQTKPKKNKI
jgi:hypothetical protein